MKRTKRSIVAALCALALTLTFTGCVTAPDGTQTADIPRIAAVAREAAQFGTLEALIEHPEWSPLFGLAATELKALADSNSIKVSDLLAILNRLPVKQLQSDNARIAFSSARILIAGANWSVVDAERLTQIRPIIVAIYEGLESGGAQ